MTDSVDMSNTGRCGSAALQRRHSASTTGSGGPWHERFTMTSSPVQVVLVPPKHGVDDLVQHVLGRFTDKLRVCVQRLIRFVIQSCSVPNQLLSACARLDQGHEFDPSRKLQMTERRL